MRAFYQAMEEDESQLEELLSMLAIATVCDVVDLTGENRIFVKEGLRRIKDTQNIGLKAWITTLPIGFHLLQLPDRMPS